MSQTLPLNAELRDCIEQCDICHRVCMETLSYCLGLGGEHAEREHIRLLADCAELCQTNENFMLRGSELHTRISRVCEAVCILCAENCERFADDETLRRCAIVCRRCAAACGRMSLLSARS